MSPNLSSLVPLSSKSFVSVIYHMTADGTPTFITGVGSIDTHCLSLHDIYHISSLILNLVFVNQLC